MPALGSEKKDVGVWKRKEKFQHENNRYNLWKCYKQEKKWIINPRSLRRISKPKINFVGSRQDKTIKWDKDQRYLNPSKSLHNQSIIFIKTPKNPSRMRVIARPVEKLPQKYVDLDPNEKCKDKGPIRQDLWTQF